MRPGLIVSATLLLAVHCGQATTNDVSNNVAQGSSKTKQLGYFTPNVFPYFPQPIFRPRPQTFRLTRPRRPAATASAPTSGDSVIIAMILLALTRLRAPTTTTASTTTTTATTTTVESATTTSGCNAEWSEWGDCVVNVNLQYRSRICPDKTEVEQQPCPTADPLEQLRGANDALQQELDELKQALSDQPQSARCYTGMKFGHIPDSALSASTEFDANHGPTRARLDTEQTGSLKGGWAAAVPVSANGEWIEVDLGTKKSLAGVILQGRSDRDEWVITYKVNCDAVTIQEDGSDKVFIGNTDRNTKVVGKFPEILDCRIVRILPVSVQVHVTLRFELINGICFDEY